MKKFVVFSMLVLLMQLPITAQASLINLGEGLVYDDYLDITWLADANYAMTSGHSSDGAMSWFDAMDWVSNLEYAGYDGWRLPTVYDTDGTTICVHPDACNDSELGHLFYEDLGGTQSSSIYNSSDPDLALFSNIVTADNIPVGEVYDTYWTSETAWSGRRYYFAFTNGSQWAKNPDDPDNHGHGVAWAVHDGRLDVTVPEPSTLLLLSLSLFGLGFKKRKASH